MQNKRYDSQLNDPHYFFLSLIIGLNCWFQLMVTSSFAADDPFSPLLDQDALTPVPLSPPRVTPPRLTPTRMKSETITEDQVLLPNRRFQRLTRPSIPFSNQCYSPLIFEQSSNHLIAGNELDFLIEEETQLMSFLEGTETFQGLATPSLLKGSGTPSEENERPRKRIREISGSATSDDEIFLEHSSLASKRRQLQVASARPSLLLQYYAEQFPYEQYQSITLLHQPKKIIADDVNVLSIPQSIYHQAIETLDKVNLKFSAEPNDKNQFLNFLTLLTVYDQAKSHQAGEIFNIPINIPIEERKLILTIALDLATNGHQYFHSLENTNKTFLKSFENEGKTFRIDIMVITDTVFILRLKNIQIGAGTSKLVHAALKIEYSKKTFLNSTISSSISSTTSTVNSNIPTIISAQQFVEFSEKHENRNSITNEMPVYQRMKNYFHLHQFKEGTQRTFNEVLPGLEHHEVYEIQNADELKNQKTLYSQRRFLLGDLSKIKFFNVEEKQKVKLLTALADGLISLHQKLKLVHGDLKLENILIDNDDEITISDFGLSYGVGYGMIQPRGGTPGYEAPEIENYLGHRKVFEYELPLIQARDIFSFGMIMHAMLQEPGIPLSLYIRCLKILKTPIDFSYNADFSPDWGTWGKCMFDPKIHQAFTAEMDAFVTKKCGPDQTAPCLYRLMQQTLAIDPDKRPNAVQIKTFLQSLSTQF